MNALQRRVWSQVRRGAEPFTLDGSPQVGMFSNVSSGTMRLYLTQAEVDATTPPYVLCLVSQEVAASAGSSLVWAGRTFQVKRVVEARWRGSVVARLLALS
jgi:hypothetical protein